MAVAARINFTGIFHGRRYICDTFGGGHYTSEEAAMPGASPRTGKHMGAVPRGRSVSPEELSDCQRNMCSQYI